MDAKQIYQRIRDEKLIAIVRGVSADQIIKIAESLYAGGIRLMEITCNTPGVTEMIEAVSKMMAGKVLVGAGTVLTKDLAKEVCAAGAQYVIAPDINPAVVEYCLERRIPVIPGAATPTEILLAKRLGVTMVKIFPAEALGAKYIRQIRGPIDDMDLVAVGGITESNVAEFLTAGCAAVGLGGSLIKKEFLDRSDWPGLTALAQRIKAKV
jgi:2-dehydro-3-deoxyphosphogluconate aldolase / (4S)-4-hydroxy-2-oxoglutarate aldolase